MLIASVVGSCENRCTCHDGVRKPVQLYYAVGTHQAIIACAQELGVRALWRVNSKLDEVRSYRRETRCHQPRHPTSSPTITPETLASAANHAAQPWSFPNATKYCQKHLSLHSTDHAIPSDQRHRACTPAPSQLPLQIPSQYTPVLPVPL